MTSAPDRTPTRRRVLPAGENGSLWEARPSCGIFEFRGVLLRLIVEDPADDKFPTHRGLSLLSAACGLMTIAPKREDEGAE